MTSAELRIGNLVEGVYAKALGETTVGVVCSIHKQSAHVLWSHEMEELSYAYNAIAPIPLTEEWLIKLGFVVESIEQWKSLNTGVSRMVKKYQPADTYSFEEPKITISVVLDYNGLGIRRIGIYGHPSLRLCDLKYVHELQNAFYLLMGEDLVHPLESTEK